MKEKIKTKLLIGGVFKNKKRIFQKLEKRKKDIKKYFYIKEEYEKGNIKDKLGFQCVYRQFYGMNTAGLTDDFFKEYFKLLDSRETDPKKILSRLFEIPRRNKTKSAQFCFTTKLLHTKNNNLPIYDSLVGKELGLRVTGKSKDDKIKSRCEIYKTLQGNYDELLGNKIIKKIILDFRKEFNCNKKKISDTKVLDFLIWAKGQL